ncbi:MAG TPA: hypothetical protein VG692_11025 [Gemmatimonadales bacterium]|nr:hypothetical protein [Gemmatimonadales bacterium]
MLTTLAFRQLFVNRGRSLLLLLGYGLGVGVMIVLLSVGQAMVDQSKDVSLIGGGEVTVLPQGIDVEAMRTGGLSGLYFSIDRARFLTRQLLGGARNAALVEAVSPVIENKLIYLRKPGGEPVAVRAGAEIPSRAAALGAGLRLLAGTWQDAPADSQWIAPTPEQLYHEIDRFHYPPTADSTWAEWHYFNLAVSADEWWYITYLVGGSIPTGRWGGRLLISRRAPGGGYERYIADLPASAVAFDTAGADLSLGTNTVRQREGKYRLAGEASGPAGKVRFDLEVTPGRNRYFPPVDLKEGEYLSGYVVPVLRGTARGTICRAGRCRQLDAVEAYHDHNWGVWRDVTWDWGAARGATFNLLYGAVYAPSDTVAATSSGAPRVLVALVDSLGVRQILRARSVAYRGRLRDAVREGIAVPAEFEFVAAREEDTVRVTATIHDFQATGGVGGRDRHFLQMRGSFRLDGRVGGVAVADSGSGFFETYLGGEQ